MSNDAPKQEFYHPCAVIRAIAEQAITHLNPELEMKVRVGMMGTLTHLLTYMNVSSISTDIPKSDLQVEGRASLLQLELSGYSESRLKVRLRDWRKLGIVDWSWREDNKGNDYIIYATPNPDVMKKATPDPTKQAQARKAVAARWGAKKPEAKAIPVARPLAPKPLQVPKTNGMASAAEFSRMTGAKETTNPHQSRRQYEQETMKALICPKRKDGEFHSNAMGICRYCDCVLPQQREWSRMKREAEDFVYV